MFPFPLPLESEYIRFDYYDDPVPFYTAIVFRSRPLASTGPSPHAGTREHGRDWSPYEFNGG